MRYVNENTLAITH